MDRAQRRRLLVVLWALFAVVSVVTPAPAYVVTKLAAEGDPTPVGGTFVGFEDVPPTVNNLGHAVFSGFILGGTATRGLFRHDGTSLTSVVIGEVSNAALNDAGKVLFYDFGPAGLLIASGGKLTPVARFGDPSPLGGTFRGFGVAFHQSMNARPVR